MSADASIVLRVTDQTSTGFSAVKRASEQVGKSFDELAGKVSALREKNRALNENYANLQVQIAEAKKWVKVAADAFKESGDEINRTNLDDAHAYYKNLTDQLNDFSAASKDTRKEIRELQNEMRKLDEIGTSGSGSAGNGSEGLSAWGLAMSGLAKQAGSAATGYASYWLNSAIGSTDAGIISSILSGAATGAATGLLAGGAGAVIGAAVGGVSGLVEGLTAQAESEDELFRSYRDELLTAALETQSAALSSGTATAAQREMDSIAFRYLLGDGAESDILLNSIKELANVTPYVYDDLTGIARQLAIFDSTSGDLYNNLVRIGDAGSAIGKSSSEMQGLAQVLGKIGDSEKYEATYTRSLRNYGINPTSIIERVFGVDYAEASAMLSGMSGSEVLSAIWQDFDTQYGGSMEAMAETYGGALSTREGLNAELEAFMGEGYTSSRALKEHNDWLTRFAQGEAYSIIGRTNAQKENMEDAIYRDVIGGIFNGDEASVVAEATRTEINRLREEYLADLREYETADEQRQMEIGADISSIYNQAQALVSTAQDIDPHLDAWDQAAIDTAEGVAAIVAKLDAYADDWAYGKVAERGIEASRYAGNGIRTYKVGPFTFFDTNSITGTSSFSSAVGKHVIPHNDFPILAHEGEMLLTANEAREFQSGGNARVTVTGNTFIVRQESDIDAIADQLAQKLERAAMIGI